MTVFFHYIFQLIVYINRNYWFLTNIVSNQLTKSSYCCNHIFNWFSKYGIMEASNNIFYLLLSNIYIIISFSFLFALAGASRKIFKTLKAINNHHNLSSWILRVQFLLAKSAHSSEQTFFTNLAESFSYGCPWISKFLRIFSLTTTSPRTHHP